MHSQGQGHTWPFGVKLTGKGRLLKYFLKLNLLPPFFLSQKLARKLLYPNAIYIGIKNACLQKSQNMSRKSNLSKINVQVKRFEIQVIINTLCAIND
jgi:hypothetical protein